MFSKCPEVSRSLINPCSAILASIPRFRGDCQNLVLTLTGSKGLGSSFRDVPGVISVDMAFDTQASPTNTAPLRLLPEQVPAASVASTSVSYT